MPGLIHHSPAYVDFVQDLLPRRVAATAPRCNFVQRAQATGTKPGALINDADIDAG